MCGYMGKLLYVNLTNKKVEIKELDEKLVRKYIGGSGLAAKILFDETNGQTDPLGEENVLIFMTGPFAGTNIPTSGRHAVVTKSPLTGIWTESDVGGSWGYEFKKTGFDGIIIKGKANKPVYLWLHDGLVEIKDAQHVWGKDTYEIDSILREETEHNAVTQSIGIAGENMVSFASIMTDGYHARAAGRGGVGAVMGSKKLKAIVVKGNKDVEVADSEKVKKIVKEISPEIVSSTEMLRKYGTSGGIEAYDKMMNFPWKNWYQDRCPEIASKINGIRMEESILTGRYHCKTCIIQCGREIEIKEGLYKGVKGAGPEYETFGTLGGLCMIDNLEAIAKANELCNRYGMDTISTGGVIAFGMEAFEKGLLTKKDTNGLELTFGNAEALIEVIHKISKKEGYLGNLLSKGVKSAAMLLGKNSEEFAIHVKGMEFPAHDPRAFFGVALSYATSNRGACHMQGLTHVFEKGMPIPELGINGHPRHQVEGKGEFTAKCQDLMCIFDSIKLCKLILFGGVQLTHVVNLYNAVTGLNLCIKEIMKIGERIYNLKRLYNVKCGISRKDDSLPQRILTHKRGPKLPPLGEMLSDYYEFRKWGETGIPTEEKLKELDLLNL